MTEPAAIRGAGANAEAALDPAPASPALFTAEDLGAVLAALGLPEADRKYGYLVACTRFYARAENYRGGAPGFAASKSYPLGGGQSRAYGHEWKADGGAYARKALGLIGVGVERRAPGEKK